MQSVEKTFHLTRADRDLLSKPEYDVQVGYVENLKDIVSEGLHVICLHMCVNIIYLCVISMIEFF